MKRPEIVCLCGSTRFLQAFRDAQLTETLAGRIVLTIGCDMRTDPELLEGMLHEQSEEIKRRLDVLHFAKIDLADIVLFLDVDGYMGDSTRRELAYAEMRGKVIRFLSEEQQS